MVDGERGNKHKGALPLSSVKTLTTLNQNLSHICTPSSRKDNSPSMKTPVHRAGAPGSSVHSGTIRALATLVLVGAHVHDREAIAVAIDDAGHAVQVALRQGLKAGLKGIPVDEVGTTVDAR